MKKIMLATMIVFMNQNVSFSGLYVYGVGGRVDSRAGSRNNNITMKTNHQTYACKHEKRSNLRDPGSLKYLKSVEGFNKVKNISITS